MPKFLVWHGVMQSYADADTVIADSPREAVKGRVFVLRSGAEVTGAGYLCSAPGDRHLALRSDSDDYYVVESVF